MELQSTTTRVTVEVTIQASAERVWKYWTTPTDIIHWNSASDSWHTIRAENNLHIGGRFNYRMEAKDGSTGFDFNGVYNNVVLFRKINYTLEDGRKVNIAFTEDKKQTTIVEIFDAETENSVELQRNGWQAILNNFKKYIETGK